MPQTNARTHLSRGGRLPRALLAQLAHEFRTPLQALLGHTHLAAKLAVDPQQHAHLEAIQTQAAHLARLVDDLVDFAALRAGALRVCEDEVDSKALAAAVLDTLRPAAASKGLSLRLDLAQGLPVRVCLDRTRTTQVLLNLLSNAVKYTPAGHVSLSVTWRPTESASGALVWRVTDTGPGIALEDQSHLFRMFSRLPSSSSTSGAGLGLAITAAMCEALGGSLQVVSDGRNGSAFEAVLPGRAVVPAVVAPPASEAAMPPAAREPVSAGVTTTLAGKRILVAEDSVAVRELLASWLESFGAMVVAVADGQLAAQKLRRSDFDVLVLDLDLPRRSGLQVLRGLRAATVKRPRIVVLSGHTDPRWRMLARKAGADVFLQKPFETAALLAELTSHGSETDLTASVGAEIPSGPADLALRLRLQALHEAEMPERLQRLRRACRARDWGCIEHETHAIKNNADLLGIERLAEACRDVQRAAGARNLLQLERKFSALETAAGRQQTKRTRCRAPFETHSEGNDEPILRETTRPHATSAK